MNLHTRHPHSYCHHDSGNLYPRKDPMKTGRIRLLNVLLITALAFILAPFGQPAQALGGGSAVQKA